MKLNENEIKFLELLNKKDFVSGQEKSDKDLAKEISKTIEIMVNSYAFKSKDLVNEIMSKGIEGNFMCIAIAFIKALGRLYINNGLYDGRNERACKVAAMVMNCPSFDCRYSGLTNYDGFNWYTDRMDVRRWEYEHDDLLDISGLVAVELSNIHRTLQQTFAGMCFYFLSQYCKDINKIMEEYINAHWYNMPMI